MKNLKKLMVGVLLMLASIGGKIAAYTFTINNQTGQDVKVRLNPFNEGGVISAGKERKFSLKCFLGICRCLKSIDVSTKQAGKWGKRKKARQKLTKVCKDRYIYLRVRQGNIHADFR